LSVTLVEPHRPVGFAENHGHPVVQLAMTLFGGPATIAQLTIHW
jgi:hypothetical protein